MIKNRDNLNITHPFIAGIGVSIREKEKKKENNKRELKYFNVLFSLPFCSVNGKPGSFLRMMTSDEVCAELS